MPQETDSASKLPYCGAFLEPGDAKAQVDPGTNGGRGGLSQLSGVTLLSPPVIAHGEKLAQKHGMSSSSPGLAAERARISHQGNADVLGLDHHLSCHQRLSLSKCFPEAGELTNSIVVATQPEPMFFTLVSCFNILVQY